MNENIEKKLVQEWLSSLEIVNKDNRSLVKHMQMNLSIIKDLPYSHISSIPFLQTKNNKMSLSIWKEIGKYGELKKLLFEVIKNNTMKYMSWTSLIIGLLIIIFSPFNRYNRSRYFEGKQPPFDIIPYIIFAFFAFILLFLFSMFLSFFKIKKVEDNNMEKFNKFEKDVWIVFDQYEKFKEEYGY